MTAVAFEELLAPGGRISFTDVWHVISADTRPSASSEPALSTSRYQFFKSFSHNDL